MVLRKFAAFPVAAILVYSRETGDTLIGVAILPRSLVHNDVIGANALIVGVNIDFGPG